LIQNKNNSKLIEKWNVLKIEEVTGGGDEKDRVSRQFITQPTVPSPPHTKIRKFFTF
jgi:hypothetical protein